MADLVQEIKDRLDIVTLVSQYVQLKKAGQNYKGLCPFHSEKTPSFVVSPEKQICHCFGCNKGGDVFSFLEELEGVTFPEAVQILAERTGVKVDPKKFAKKKEEKSQKEAYFDSHELACSFFEKQLHSTASGKKVLNYLYKRGVTDETIKIFRLGFAPDEYDKLHPYLLKKGFRRDVLLKSGLASTKKIDSDHIYDKFRARLIFPIFDYFGRVCGFGGRALKKDQMPKYLNSAENLIYNKSNVLYGLSHAKKSVKEKDSVVFVEGYLDVLLPYQVGVENVVATSGTALTQGHVRVIKRITSNVVTCFDADEAGFEATKRAYTLLQSQGVFLKMVTGLDAKDPADYVLEHGDAFADILKEAQDFLHVFINRLLSEHDVHTVHGQRNILNSVLPFLKSMTPANQDFYVRELAQKINMKEGIIYDEINRFQLSLNNPAKLTQENEKVDMYKMSLGEIVCSILIGNAPLFKKVVDSVKVENFNDDMKDVYKGLLDQYNASRETVDNWNFKKGFSAQIKEKIDILGLYAQEQYGAMSEELVEMELVKLLDKMSEDRINKQLSELQKEIRKAEEADEKEKLMKLLALHKDLLAK